MLRLSRLDEFYSWYQYDPELKGKSVSAAEYIDGKGSFQAIQRKLNILIHQLDVNKEYASLESAVFATETDIHLLSPIILIDGLTKNHRLPGWRVCWVVGPKQLIKALGQSGSYLDGGASHPTQIAAIPLLEPKRVQQDKEALQRCFLEKRNHALKRLEEIGLSVDVPPQGRYLSKCATPSQLIVDHPTATFYIWLDLSGLPEPLNSGLTFFEECLKEKTIVVPGVRLLDRSKRARTDGNWQIFFDVNPSHRRNLFHSPCGHYVRLSFGPTMQELDRGLDGIQRLVERARASYAKDGHVKGTVGGYKQSGEEDKSAGRLDARASGS